MKTNAEYAEFLQGIVEACMGGGDFDRMVEQAAGMFGLHVWQVEDDLAAMVGEE